MTFEESLKKLELITEKMKNGATTLEEALEFYEEGLNCYEQCSEILNKAELKIEVFSR